MPIDFPSSPTTGQVYTYLGKSWVYNGTGWDAPRALSEIGAVRTFANATARTAAIPFPTEGIVAYLNDSNSLQVYDGAVWTAAGGVSSGNAIINGAFEINQRGFVSTSTNDAYTFDRWQTEFLSATTTYSSEAFTPGAAPVSGQESLRYLRIVTSGATGSTYGLIKTKIEDVRTFAGQTVTASFWARAASGTPKVTVRMNQTFGSGGSTFVAVNAPSAAVISTSWARYSFTISLPSISGKTIGANNFLALAIMTNDAILGSGVGLQNASIDIWGVQLEAGPVATPFRRNAPSIQAELAACQRYYFASGFMNIFQSFIVSSNDTFRRANLTFPVTLRRVPTEADISVSWSGGTPGLDSFTANQFRAYTAVGDSTTERVLTSFTVSVEL
jgi:hypothetical protein